MNIGVTITISFRQILIDYVGVILTSYVRVNP